MNATAGKPFLISTSLVDLGIRSEQSIIRHERWCLTLTLAVFALFAAYSACTIPLWFDEFFTLFISRLPSLSEMLQAMPADSQPPLQYLLTHLSLRLFGEAEFAVRLPEMLAYLAAGLLTYRIVRRHGTAVQALFALTMLLGSFISFQLAHTARPYGLLMAFTALVFASWQVAASRQKNRLFPLCGVALGIAGAILSHHFGIFHVGLFLATGETVRSIRRRRLDGKMVAAIAVGLSPLAFTLPLAEQTHMIFGEALLRSANFYSRPSLINLFSYLLMVALPLLCMVAAFAFLPWPERTASYRASDLPPVPVHEWFAAGALSLLLPAMMLLAALETHYLITRYAIGASLGLALLAGWALPRLFRPRYIAQPLLALSSLCFVLLIAVILLIENMHQAAWSAQPGADAASPLLLHAPSELPIVIANFSEYPVEWWYAPTAAKQRLVYLSDVQYALKQPDFMGELTLVADEAYIPTPILDYAAFIGGHSRFLLLRTGVTRYNFIESRLTSAGWQLNVIASSGRDVLYRVDQPGNLHQVALSLQHADR